MDFEQMPSAGVLFVVGLTEKAAKLASRGS